MSFEIKLLKRHYIFDSIHDAEKAKQILEQYPNCDHEKLEKLLEEYGLNYEYDFEAHFRRLEDENSW